MRELKKANEVLKAAVCAVSRQPCATAWLGPGRVRPRENRPLQRLGHQLGQGYLEELQVILGLVGAALLGRRSPASTSGMQVTSSGVNAEPALVMARRLLFAECAATAEASSPGDRQSVKSRIRGRGAGRARARLGTSARRRSSSASSTDSNTRLAVDTDATSRNSAG